MHLNPNYLLSNMVNELPMQFSSLLLTTWLAKLQITVNASTALPKQFRTLPRVPVIVNRTDKLIDFDKDDAPKYRIR